ncbi:MAG: acyl-CoA/acyl-ACP dehydrogenase [Chloroflexota bacterium]|nr:acyl-CoA/acyl-ACP dehydrogenase [Chloroflexota bacterium]
MEAIQEEKRTRYDVTDPVALAEKMAEKIAPNAERYDRENEFAEESIRVLQRNGYAALTVPETFGGLGAGLYDLVRAQERLAMGDGAVALAIGMSLIKIVGQATKRSWPEHLYEKVMRAATERGALVNSVASEPRLGSPSRGGKPETVAIPTEDGGWRITGHKTFGSLAPVLDFIVVTATIQDGTDDVGRFMLERGEGVHVKETWDAMGMRATGSHDMIFDGAYAEPGSLLSRSGGGGEASSEREEEAIVPTQNPFFALPVSAVYLGIATEAHEAAVRYARNRVPLALGHPLSEVDAIRDKLADNERELRAARMMLYDTARRAEGCKGNMDEQLKLDVYVAKHSATNNAVSVVDRAMRVVGGAALARGSILERAYRNVRAGLLHPPADDITSRVLAEWTINANSKELSEQPARKPHKEDA